MLKVIYVQLVRFCPLGFKKFIKRILNRAFSELRMLKLSIFNKLNWVVSRFELQLVQKPKASNRPGINLNVGCGEYEIANFISVDFYSSHYYESEKFDRVHYDMRSDNLPFHDESADVIYCSHVIEHIETVYVEHFLAESYRVLKSGGILRLACPDSLFLYERMRDFPEYWVWHPSYKIPDDATKCFIDEVASHRVNLINFGLEKEIEQYEYSDLMEKLRIDGEFNQADPGRHINSFDFERLKRMGYSVGFNKIVQSRSRGSLHPNLQGFDMDLTHPAMSLYVDMVKNYVPFTPHLKNIKVASDVFDGN